MKITSKKKLIDYIKIQLGHPIIQVEIHDMQLSQIIDDAVQKFTEYSYSYLEESVVIQLEGRGTYQLPEAITNIIKLTTTNTRGFDFNMSYGEGNVPQVWSEMYFSMNSGTVAGVGGGSFVSNIIPMMAEMGSLNATMTKFFDEKIAYNFNPNKKILQLLEDKRGAALIHYNYEYVANEDNDYIYDHEWIKAYTVAKAKYTWGNNIGKFSQSLVGGASLNFDRIISEGQQEIEKLDQELITKWCDPAPILIG